MILYLDTSALVKAYVSEDFSGLVLESIKQAEAVATHLIAYVETHSALARLRRERVLKEKAYERVKREFEKDWPNYVVVEAGAELIRRAAQLVQTFPLRAYDSIHLASADYLRSPDRSQVLFACFDNKLNQAASEMGFDLLSIEKKGSF